MSEEEANEVRAKNEEIRKERDSQATKIADKFACFKRDFVGAPIWKAMKDIIDKKTPGKPVQINYRKNERYWLFPEDKAVSCTFEIEFETIEDISLARIFLLEL